MNWYKGNIAEAVAESKAKNAIFVVYVQGKDEASEKLSSFLNDPTIYSKLATDNFVSIKIESDSQSYMQFASIYQMVPVPSIFFIGDSGTPLEIGTGILADAQELERKIDRVLSLTGKATATTASSDLLGAERQAAASAAAPSTSRSAASEQKREEEVICDGDVCHKKPKEVSKEPPAPTADSAESPQAASDRAEAMEHARKVIEQKRLERDEAEKKAEQEQELRRRREQRDVQKLSEWKKEQEYKEAIETRRRERLEEKNARERILAKIASDKAERAQKFAAPNDGGAAPAATEASSAASSGQATPSAATAPDSTRLQFRFPNGVTSSHAFPRAQSLATVRAYIQAELAELLAGLKEFTLATTYPKREFGPDDEAKTLTELALFPSAVILVLGRATGHNAVLNETNRFAIFTFLLNMIMSPFLAIYNYFTKPHDGAAAASSAGGKDSHSSSSDNTDTLRREAAAKRRRLDGFAADSGQSQSNDMSRRGTAARRYGGVNIHRLSDSPKDSDDENATWNGNSTQQQ